MSTAVLVTAHRAEMQTITDLAIRDLSVLWAGLDIADALAVRAALNEILPELVELYGSAAAAAGADWYENLRDDAEIPGGFRAIAAELPDAGRMESLAGWAIDPLFGALPDSTAALNRTAGGLQRIVANADRETVMMTALADPAAQGWRRTGSGSCEFCRMQINRGAVFSESTAGFHSHDKCRCVAVPAWKGQPKPARAAHPDRPPHPGDAPREPIEPPRPQAPGPKPKSPPEAVRKWEQDYDAYAARSREQSAAVDTARQDWRAATTTHREQLEAHYQYGREPLAKGGMADVLPSTRYLDTPDDYIAEAETVFARVPKDVQDKLSSHGVSVDFVPDGVTPAATHLANQSPRGWPPGSTWEQVGGIYDPNTRTVVAGPLQSSGRPVNVFAHEVGHAVDDAYGGLSQVDAEWVDLTRRAAEIPQVSPYFKQGVSGRVHAGQQELFAEAFGAITDPNSYVRLVVHDADLADDIFRWFAQRGLTS